MTDMLLADLALQPEQTAVFSSLTVARGYADLVSNQILTGALSDTMLSTLVCLQDALQEHERRMRVVCGLADRT